MDTKRLKFDDGFCTNVPLVTGIVKIQKSLDHEATVTRAGKRRVKS